MFAEERQQQICALLDKGHMVRAAALTQRFGVSLETIRRDLCALEYRGLLQRVHGGAIPVREKKAFYDFSTRLQVQNQQKRDIALLAIEQISEGDVIALDSGTTTWEMAKILPSHFQHLTVVTNSVPVLAALTEEATFQVVVPGGQLATRERVLYGELCLEQLKKFHVDKAFLAPSCVSLEAGFTDYNLDLIRMQQAYLAIADRVIMLADSSKFETTALSRICSIEEGGMILTDANLEPELYQLYVQNEVMVLKKSAKTAREERK